MSLSQQERPSNPAKFFMKVKSGTVSYYDKSIEQNVSVPTPLEFIVLDQVAAIKGWSDADESMYWSNEVRSISKDEVTVRTSKGVRETGIWKNIKGSPNIAGAKYTASIYIAHKSGEGLVISNLALSGSSLKPWIEFTKKHRVTSSKVVISGWADAKKGAVNYKTPIFEAVAMSDSEKQEAIALDEQLQVYLNQYFSYRSDEGGHTAIVGASEDVILEDVDNDIDYSAIPF